MRRILTTLIAVVAISVVLFLAILPPRPVHLEPGPAWADLASHTVPGGYHIHTTRSDGTGDKPTIARAAARAGLKFLILTDHGDGTRPPDPPEYIDGVLVLDAVEISTDDGHYVALDMPRAPYPLGGSGEAVVEDVRRLGGFGIAAHPDSPKIALRWTGSSAPIDGIEWLNADSEWRNDSRVELARAAVSYPFRRGPALGSLLDRPPTLDRWDRLAASRPIVVLAGVDAHGGIGRRMEDGSRSGMLGIPGYEASFRTFSNRVIVDRLLSGEAATDARAIYRAIRSGHVFSTIDALAAPGLLDFHLEPNGTIVARALMPAGAELILLRAGQELARTGGDLHWDTSKVAGAYRVEVHLPSAPGTPPIPWLVSNALSVRVSSQLPTPNSQGAQVPPGVHLLQWPWRIENDPSSSGILRTRRDGAELEYGLSGGSPRSQFVALASDLHEQAFSAIDVSLGSDRPMRVSVQVRTTGGERWGRSVYVAGPVSPVRVPLTAMRPIETAPAAQLSATAVTSILLVVDLTNAQPGRRGVLRVGGAALE